MFYFHTSTIIVTGFLDGFNIFFSHVFSKTLGLDWNVNKPSNSQCQNSMSLLQPIVMNFMWMSNECKLEISEFNGMAIIFFLFGNNELALYLKCKV